MSILRVSKGSPCVICDKSDWCGISEDDSFAICMRIEEGSVCQTQNGGWLHRLHDREQPRQVSATIDVRPMPDFGALVEERVRATPFGTLSLFAASLGILLLARESMWVKRRIVRLRRRYPVLAAKFAEVSHRARETIHRFKRRW